MPEYRIISSRILFDHPWVQIVVDTLEFQGRLQPYLYLASPVEAVATVGVTATGDIILTRQYRHPLGKVIYDLPAGRLEPGEDALTGARREFEDESEVLEVVFKPVAEVLSMILNREVIDGSLQSGVLLALQKGLLQ
jgi:hypothetical protein